MHIDSFQSQLPSAAGVRARRFACAVLVLAAVSVAANVRADEYLAVIGGPGGGQFEARCPDGELLIGFEVRGADDVDAIRPFCAPAFGPREVGPASQGGWHGGTGGRLKTALCPADRPIVLGLVIDAEGVDTIIVNTLLLDCGLAADTQVAKQDPSRYDAGFIGPHYLPSQTRFGFGFGSEGTWASGLHDQQRCPVGQVAVGVHGRSGIWLDAIGLMCGAPRLQPKRTTVSSIGKHVGGAPATGGPPMSICERARDARARNSPAAPNLEAQCAASKTIVPSIGRVNAGVPSTPSPAKSLCERARDARARNSPAAPNLEAQCAAREP